MPVSTISARVTVASKISSPRRTVSRHLSGGAADQGNRLLVAGFGNLLPLDGDNLVPRFQNSFSRRTVTEIEDGQGILFILLTVMPMPHISPCCGPEMPHTPPACGRCCTGRGRRTASRRPRWPRPRRRHQTGSGCQSVLPARQFSCHLGRNRRCPLPEAPELLAAEGKDAPQHKSRRKAAKTRREKPLPSFITALLSVLNAKAGAPGWERRAGKCRFYR